MGMDVYGRNPRSESGEYFRNNVWYWHPLWDYCCQVAPELAGVVENGHNNSGDGLDADGAEELAEILFAELESGRTAEYEQEYRNHLASLSRKDCQFCDATGIRSDETGVSMGMPKRELEIEMQILTGRTHGWCNACRGEGKVDAWETNYPFEVGNVREFAKFLRDCGGFQIC